MTPSARLFALLLGVCVAGCRKPVPPDLNWTGELRMAQDRTLPFHIVCDLSAPKPSAFFLNGPERTQVPEVRVHGDSIAFVFSEYRAAMLGVWTGAEWRGEFFRYRTDTTSNAFVMRPGLPTAEPRSPQTSHALTGTFRAFQETPKGVDSLTTASFRVKGDSVFGTLIAPDGDFGLLAGVQSGTRVILNRYTGWQAFILELDQAGEGWTARLFARFGTPQTYRLEPRPAAVMEAPAGEEVRMKDPALPFAFRGITPEGDTIASTDARFRGKVLLIDIMGTWCHNCMDAAPLLEELARTYRKEGFEVVGLAFEVSGDPAIAGRNLALYRSRYGIDFPTLFCGSTKDGPSLIGSQADGFSSYPTTFFTDRRGRVRRVHVGFRGPGTGDLHQRQVQQYHEIVRSLLK